MYVSDLNAILSIIQDYLNDGGKWMHIDMAGPVHNGERATGYGVGLLYSLLLLLQDQK